MSSSIIKIWDRQKRYVVFIAAAMPLLGLPVSFLLSDPVARFTLAFSVLASQVSLLLALAFQILRSVEKRSGKTVTKIQLNSDFWMEGRHYKTLDLNAINGERFIEMLATQNIRVDAVRVIAPTDKAVQTFYEDDVVVMDRRKAISTVVASLDSIVSNLEQQKSKAVIKRYDVRRVGTFPLDFYAIFNSTHCMVGKYVKDPLRKHTIGIKSLSWIENDPVLVTHHAQHFAELWDSLQKPE